MSGAGDGPFAPIVKFLKKPPHRKRKALRDLAERKGVLDPIMRARAHAAFAFSRIRRGRPHHLDTQLVVSLTSYPPRYATLHLTLKTLLSQDIRPDLVVLYVFEGDVAALPDAVLGLVGRDFEIRRVAHDIRSYKKLIPALRDFPEAVIVTADDDVRYRTSWLSELVLAYDPSRREVLGRRAHRIRSDEAGGILPYAQWEHRVAAAAAGPDILPTGVGGILYPPGTFGEEVHDSESFAALCPLADDIWFYFMARLNGVSCRKVGDGRKDYYWEPSQRVALATGNVEGLGNDAAMARMIARFGNPLSVGFGHRAPVDPTPLSG
ncbi:MAG: hypothetical protein U1F47_05970 [Hyphomicrobiales bacterium]